MPKTKQTAKKSTGAPAEHLRLQNTPAPISSSSLFISQVPADIPHDPWCCICGLGGNCYDCDSCPRTMCDRCLTFTGPSPAGNLSVSFHCVHCHVNSKRRNGAYLPFWQNGEAIQGVVGLVAVPSIRGHFPRMNTQPLALINLRLAGVDKCGDPFKSVVSYLEGIFPSPNDLKTLDVEFDIKPNSAKLLEAYQRPLRSFAKQMCQQGVRRLIVFLYTHSNPDNGDLHCTKGGALEVHEFLAAVISPELAGYASQCHSIMFLEVCGGIWSSQCARDHLFQYAKSGPFNYIFGYTQHDFSPNYATSFSFKLSHKLFVECYSVLHALPGILNEEEGLGAHTAINVLSANMGVQFFWCHKSWRPSGFNAPIQCPGCFSIKTLTFTPHPEPWRFTARCRCGWSFEQDVGTPNAKFPPEGTGWGRLMLYGSEKDYTRIRNASRDTYDTL